MKTSITSLTLLLLTLALSGCATGSCDKKAGCADSSQYFPPAQTVAPAAQAVTAPEAPEVAPESEPAAEKIPAAVMK